jgi:hypothetical protein
MRTRLASREMAQYSPSVGVADQLVLLLCVLLKG